MIQTKGCSRGLKSGKHRRLQQWIGCLDAAAHHLVAVGCVDWHVSSLQGSFGRICGWKDKRRRRSGPSDEGVASLVDVNFGCGVGDELLVMVVHHFR